MRGVVLNGIITLSNSPYTQRSRRNVNGLFAFSTNHLMSGAEPALPSKRGLADATPDLADTVRLGTARPVAAQVNVVLKLLGRSCYSGDSPIESHDQWMLSFADSTGRTLHVRALRRRARHHIVEAAFKALSLSLRSAVREHRTCPRSITSAQ